MKSCWLKTSIIKQSYAWYVSNARKLGHNNECWGFMRRVNGNIAKLKKMLLKNKFNEIVVKVNSKTGKHYYEPAPPR